MQLLVSMTLVQVLGVLFPILPLEHLWRPESQDIQRQYVATFSACLPILYCMGMVDLA